MARPIKNIEWPKTYSDLSIMIDLLIERETKLEKIRDNYKVESQEFWFWHDFMIEIREEIEAWLPGGAAWKHRPIHASEK